MAAIRSLGGHDLCALQDVYESIDERRPTVIFAYAIKGYGGRPGRKDLP
jgi:pyruvate dehydrogenase E1 component